MSREIILTDRQKNLLREAITKLREGEPVLIPKIPELPGEEFQVLQVVALIVCVLAHAGSPNEPKRVRAYKRSLIKKYSPCLVNKPPGQANLEQARRGFEHHQRCYSPNGRNASGRARARNF